MRKQSKNTHLPKMKLFQIGKRKFALLGIGINQRPFNTKSMLACLAYGLNISFGCIFLFNGGEIFLECIESIYMVSANITLAIAFININFKMAKLFEILKRVEKTLNKSEQKNIIYLFLK